MYAVDESSTAKDVACRTKERVKRLSRPKGGGWRFEVPYKERRGQFFKNNFRQAGMLGNGQTPGFVLSHGAVADCDMLQKAGKELFRSGVLHE